MNAEFYFGRKLGKGKEKKSIKAGEIIFLPVPVKRKFNAACWSVGTLKNINFFVMILKICIYVIIFL